MAVDKKNLLYFIFAVVSYVAVYSQQEDDWAKMPDYIGKSPEAASLLRYGDMNIDLSKGQANVSVPLGAVEAGDFILPVALTYDPSGIKVTQEATWVGLGWNLTPGAQIILDVRDTPDENVQGMMPYVSEIDAVHNSVAEWDVMHPDWMDLRRESWIKDVYHFNSPTARGKFILGNEEEMIPIVYPPDAFKVETFGSAEVRRFKITDKLGNVYEFNDTREITTPVGVSGAQDYTSAWYVDKITTPDNKEIIFTYIHDGFHAKVSLNEQLTHTVTSIDCSWIYTGEALHQESVGSLIERNTISTTKTYKLTSIEAPGQRVIFELETGRLDLQAPSQLVQSMYPQLNVPPSYLGKVIFQRNETNNFAFVKGYSFLYSYFTANGVGPDYDMKRLRLEAVQNMVSDEITSFTYSSVNLPSKKSKAMDAWGYHNGAANYQLMPKHYIQYLPQTNSPFIFHHFGNADRRVNPTAVQAGLLTEIQYPTKGYTKFVYEPNTYRGVDEISKVSEVILSSNLVAGLNIPDIPIEQCVMLECEAQQIINYSTAPGMLTMARISYNIIYNGTLTINKYQYARVRVYQNGTSNPIYDSGVWKASYSVSDATFYLSGSGYVQVDVYGPTMSVANLQMRYLNEDNTIKDVYGPGVRVKEILNYTDADKLANKKVYTYEVPNSGVSSGKLVFPDGRKFDFNHHTLHTLIICKPPNYSNGQLVSFPILGWKNVTKRIYDAQVPFFSMNEVAYTHVTEENIAVVGTDETGTTDYEFSFLPVSGSQDGTIRIEYDWMRGNPLKKEVKNAAGFTVYKESNEYVDDTRTISLVKGFKLYFKHTFVTHPSATTGLPDTGPPIVQENMAYNYTVAWHYKSRTQVEEHFYDAGNNHIGSTSRVETYHYDNPDHMQLTRTETLTSTGDIRKRVNYYPHDVESEQPLMSALISANRVGEIVRNEMFLGAEKLSGQNKVYRDWGNGIISPEIIQSVKGTLTPYINKLRIVEVDAIGNPVDVMQENGMHVSYIWGYHSTKPVAKIENAAFSSIPSNLIESIKDASNHNDQATLESRFADLRVASEMSGAMVSTFSYYPLVGIRTATDPKGITTTYSYDPEGRLSGIYDNDGNILSAHEYHYRPN